MLLNKSDERFPGLWLPCTAAGSYGADVGVKHLLIAGDPSASVCTYLEDLLCVVHAVDPDVVLQRGAVGVGEEHQPQTFGRPHVQRLSHQCEGAQLLGEKPARLGLELAVIGLRHQLFAHEQDILEEARRGTNEV